MSNFIVVIFPTEKQAYEGRKALRELQDEAKLTIYGMALINKGTDGNVAMKDEAGEAPSATAVGAVAGSLIGLLGGPVALAIGAAGGVFLGQLVDAFNYGVGMGFVEEVSRNLSPGKSALVAEVDEYGTVGLDLKMEALGGIVVRQWRVNVEQDLIGNDIRCRKSELLDLRTEYEQAAEEHKARLKVRIGVAEAKLRTALESEKAKVERLKQQADVKIKALQKQIAMASPETRTRIEHRLGEIQTESEKLSTNQGSR
ncbi:DUF1269 domain-containing protein [Nitrosospira sp. NpAV]|uniref:DUF1269 domain-containing protein n=1 Tax=Nitrosospira sp. NpAV TaxID=58133 RepID=UPI00059F4A61|nr:DUF1269 domain-containing protein [Nitrosospira sp. NpAV]KIO49518.1 hypothetical protein SQ11_05115 [Nitrosospira sp. NpAV]